MSDFSVIRLQILIEEAITACRENETITVRTLVPPSRMSTVRSKMTSASSRQSPAQTNSRPPSTPGSKSDNRSEETKSSLSERSKISTPEPEYLERYNCLHISYFRINKFSCYNHCFIYPYFLAFYLHRGLSWVNAQWRSSVPVKVCPTRLSSIYSKNL